LSLAITEARISAGKGSSAEAMQKLLATSQRARMMGLIPYELQARLAISEIQTADGATGKNKDDKDKARTGVASLRRDAMQSSYKLIARHADALLAAQSVH
jgi:hypothetical protein